MELTFKSPETGCGKLPRLNDKWGVPQIIPYYSYFRLTEPDCHAAFLAVVEDHYCYYKYYVNSLVALVGAFSTYIALGHSLSIGAWLTALFVAVELFLISKDSLSKYYERAGTILGKFEDGSAHHD